MRARRANEPGRVASTLELFFDLVFVVAVSNASVNLHHAIAEGHAAHGIESYLLVFFAIWWAWMNFTWFATSFDTDDWLYRVLTIGQMGGVMILTAGIAIAFAGDMTVTIVGYVVMRVFMICQWLRAARSDGEGGRAALWYACGIAVVQVVWILWLLFANGLLGVILLFVLIAAELAVPLVAENRGRTPWHPHHITERYGAFTLIVLGESLLASTNAIIEAHESQGHWDSLIPLAMLSLLITAALWWIYFWPAHHTAISTFASSLRYGYGHYLVFAAAAAVSVGVELATESAGGESEVSTVAVGYALAIPVAVFLLAVLVTAYVGSGDRVVYATLPIAAALVLIDPLLGTPVWFTMVIVAVVVVILVVRKSPAEDEHSKAQVEVSAESAGH